MPTTLVGTDDGSRAGLLGRRRYLFVLSSIHNVILVVNGEDLLAIQSDLHKRLVSLWWLESADLLILPHEVGSSDPEGTFPASILEAAYTIPEPIVDHESLRTLCRN